MWPFSSTHTIKVLIKVTVILQLTYYNILVPEKVFCPGHIYLYTAARIVFKTHQFDLLMQFFARSTVAITTNKQKKVFLKETDSYIDFMN